ncbi:MAG: hypothetical protein ACLR30_03325 [[Clostridium] leptum]
MRKIASYLRRFFLPVLGIVALLVIQAVCDLSLPDYTSKIVNVGIQQGGLKIPRRSRYGKARWKSFYCWCLKKAGTPCWKNTP